jgi:hypothetical protein
MSTTIGKSIDFLLWMRLVRGEMGRASCVFTGEVGDNGVEIEKEDSVKEGEAGRNSSCAALFSTIMLSVAT